MPRGTASGCSITVDGRVRHRGCASLAHKVCASETFGGCFRPCCLGLESEGRPTLSVYGGAPIPPSSWIAPWSRFGSASVLFLLSLFLEAVSVGLASPPPCAITEGVLVNGS